MRMNVRHHHQGLLQAQAPWVTAAGHDLLLVQQQAAAQHLSWLMIRKQSCSGSHWLSHSHSFLLQQQGL
jgi:hypothetical protein